MTTKPEARRRPSATQQKEIQTYGADAADWLARWDAGRSCWSVEMGGFGPGYEQCIQITTAEILRWLLANKPDPLTWTNPQDWKRDYDAIAAATDRLPLLNALGLSGAQWGAALSLATRLYLRGPRAVLTAEAVKDRRIQVSRDFPVGKVG